MARREPIDRASTPAAPGFPASNSLRSSTITRAARLVLLASVALLSACNLPPGELSAPPLFEYSKTAEGDVRWITRPLVSYQRQGERREVDVLWPIGRWKAEGRERRMWLLPIYNKWVNETPEGELDSDTILLPFMWGDDPAQGRYFAMLPLAGTLKGLFAQERIDLGLFPLYARVTNRSQSVRARRSHHVLWPIFNKVNGKHDRGWRFFPFYAQYSSNNDRGEPHYERRSILWPIWVNNREGLDSTRPTHLRWFFPFYAATDSPTIRRRAYLWPLLQYERDDRRERRRLTVFPFAFAWGKNVRQYDLWPVFGVRSSPTYFRQSLLWLIQRYERAEVDSFLTENFWFLPFVQYHRRRDLVAHTESVRGRVWPFGSYRRSAEGKKELYIPDLLILPDEDHFEPLYARLWRLYRYTDNGPTGGVRWDLLWGLFGGERLGNSSRLSLFGGLFFRERRGDDVAWRIFYIPFGSRESSSEPGEE